MSVMSIHRALSALKTTEKRFEKEKNAIFISTTVGQTETCNGRSVKDVEVEIRANYDSVLSLLKNYEKLKLAIIRSNSGITSKTEGVDFVQMDDGEYLVAEIIAKQKFIIPMMQNLVDAWTRQLTMVNNEIERANKRVSEDATTAITAMSGGDKNKITTEQANGFMEVYYKNNSMFAVDPLKLQEKVRKLKDDIDKFSIEADSKLSEVNALRTVEVNIQ